MNTNKSTLLLISSKSKDREFAANLAKKTSLSLEIINQPEAAMQRFDSDDVKMILVDTSTKAQYQSLEKIIQTTHGAYSDRIRTNIIHFISSSNIEHINNLLQSPVPGHLICRHNVDGENAAAQYSHIIKGIAGGNGYLLKNLLSNTAKIQSFQLESTSMRSKIVEAIKNHLMKADYGERSARIISNAADELLMNAVFDAPVDKLGRVLYSSMPRNTVMPLKGRNRVELQLGFDKESVAIMVCDQFGSLDKLKLFSCIARRYINREYKVRTSMAGAGLGLASIYNSGGSLYFYVEAGIKTAVAAFFRKTKSTKKLQDRFHFISTQFNSDI